MVAGHLAEMMSRHAQRGRVDAILLRPGRRVVPNAVKEADLGTDGFHGDHARPGKRAVSLIQAEHLPVIAAFLGRDTVPPELLRRNLVVSGINLLALRGCHVRIGRAIIFLDGICAPCSRMEEVLGLGGYNAMRGHGGMIAEVTTPGRIATGDLVCLSE